MDKRDIVAEESVGFDSIYAIGDLQGCYHSTCALLEKINEKTPDARYLFVGDLVNRGVASLNTLRLVRSLCLDVNERGPRAMTVLGNHDLHLLAVAKGIRPLHRDDTFNDILMAPDRDILLDWCRHQPLALYIHGYLCVHAGVLPQWSLMQTLALADQVHQALRSEYWVDFLAQMFGDTPTRWEEVLHGYDRLRCIVNVLTRLRFCTVEGEMEFFSKGKFSQIARSSVMSYLPWFEIPNHAIAKTTVIFGHWSTYGLLIRSRQIGLDTGCVWGGALTAMRLSDRFVIQV